MQPQGHLQMMVNTLDYGHEPAGQPGRARAGNGPKARPSRSRIRCTPLILSGLRAMGHQVESVESGGAFGRGQIIWRLPEGGYVAGSDKRADGYAGSL